MAGRRQTKSVAADVLAKLPEPSPAADAEQVTRRQDGDVLEARSTSRRIKTVKDLLEHIEADLSIYEVAASEATTWECASSDGKGGTTVTELHRVFVRLKPQAPPAAREFVEAMISAASGRLRRPPIKKHRPRCGLWQVLPIADPHFGKYAYKGTTGQANYDLSIAARVVRQSAAELLAIGDSYKPARRSILLLGDVMHYDNPKGQTTAGTQLERDGRVQKMIEVATDVIVEIIDRSADKVPTDVSLVNGNHDETLSWALQRILIERFRNDGRVRISSDWKSRQYLSEGGNLIGITHGHKAKKKLPQLMALEVPELWSRCQYREWHTGHFHSQAADQQCPIDTIAGVITRTSPSVAAVDDWHVENGYIGSRRAMESFVYRQPGGLDAMFVAGVDS